MYKISFLVIFSLIAQICQAQFDYRNTDRLSVPIVGKQYGLIGLGFTAMLNNRDDINADGRLDQETINFNWATGLDFVNWKRPHFGYGAQILYWNAGAKYKGFDTLTKLHLEATTKLTYLKIPLLIYYKSFNRYRPERRLRFNAFFGPYIAIMNDFSDEISFIDKNVTPEVKNTTVFGPNGYSANGTNGGSIDKPIYQPLDYGFVLGSGVEVRLWKRTVIAMGLRTDVGFVDVEFKGQNKLTPEGLPSYDFGYWNGLYSKYYNNIDPLNIPNRPTTRTFNFGSYLTIKKFF